MPPQYPHLDGSTQFPWNTPPQPYQQYQNTFDYTNWEAGTTITLLSVPWDGTYNTVKWDTDTERDTWMTSQPDAYTTTLTIPTRMTGRTVKIPLPYDMGARYNYLWLQLAASPVDGEQATGIRNWGFFITSLEYRAPSATELTLDTDWWTTFINRVQIASVQLTQGHWAIANSATVADYLKDPLGNTLNLTDSEGDTLGEARQVNDITTATWNTGEQTAVLDIGITDVAATDWGNELPTTGTPYTVTNGQPTGYMLAIPADSLETFFSNAPTGLKLSITALWLIPTRLLTLTQTGEHWGVQCSQVVNATDTPQDITLTADQFHYPTEAASLTKLYTGQYARILLTRDDGTQMSIPVDAVSSSPRIHARTEVTDSGARILAYLTGISSADTTSIDVQRLDTNSVTTGGAWQTTLQQWDIPSYTVRVSSKEATAWTKHYERDNSNARALAAYQNAIASADNALSTATASADTAQTNTNNSADNALSTATASADTAQTNTNNSADTSKNNTTRSTNNNVANTALAVATSTSNQQLNNELTEDSTNLNIYLAEDGLLKNLQSQVAKLGAQGIDRETTDTDELQKYLRLGSIHGTDVPAGSNVWTALRNADLDQTYTNTQYSVMRQAQADGVATTALNNITGGLAGIASSYFGGQQAMTAPVPKKAGAGYSLATQASAYAGVAGAAASYAVNLIGSNIAFNVSLSKENAMQDASRIYQIGDGVALGDGGKVGVAMTNLLYQNQQERILAIQMTGNANDGAKYATFGGTVGTCTVRHGTISTATSVNKAENDLATQQQSNDKATTDENATDIQTVTKANATRTRDTTVSNATGTNTVTKANATRTHDTTVSNATSTNTVTKANAKRTYDAALATTQASVDTDGRAQPIDVCPATGNSGMWASHPVGITIRVERPTDGVLTRIADRMNRYGYICRRTISTPALNQMPKFTYWQCSEAWVRPRSGEAPREAVTRIKQALESGVTVWRDPSRIGDSTQ